jgi:isopentenyl diphosphate isomerase/L-lactate dehydrogenase-like FMN-dependent dehydrogenase
MFKGLDMKDVTPDVGDADVDFVKRVKDVTKMKVLIKGLESGDDAALAVSSGADGIIVSNHGGRATETGRPTIDALPEVVQGAGGRLPVLLDGGVRRGTDVFKALALGAAAVGIGRPYIWGLSSFGQAGVERVLQILNYRAAAGDGRLRHAGAEGHQREVAHRHSSLRLISSAARRR